MFFENEDELKRAERDRQGMEEKYGKYGYDFSENRVDIRGKDIVVERDDCKMYMLPADDMRHFTIAYNTNTHCDICYGHMGETSLLNMTSSPSSACVIIEDKSGQIQAASWVWVDEDKDLFVFDTFEFHKDYEDYKYADLIKDYVKAIPYQNVHMSAEYYAGDLASIPFGKKCEEKECASRPDNSHLHMGKNSCYSEYHACQLPLCLKKNGEIVEKKPDSPGWRKGLEEDKKDNTEKEMD